MAMKAMKAIKAKKSGKSLGKGMKKKAKRVSKVSYEESVAKSSVFRGTKRTTGGGLTKSGLVKNKVGKVVSKKKHEFGKKIYNKGIKRWIEAVMKARKALNLKGYVSVGGSSAPGKALLTKARALYKK
uniref:Dinoflagellate viral nucleoprotein DVNP.11 n=1 Tax=Hematodinium sp. SG-2012 TaxID=1263730 RepID=K9NVA3_9DINO|nr:dinoflagellate viral nucleoprotein DVNP.11 [Hematodinium sp. SG-2012]